MHSHHAVVQLSPVTIPLPSYAHGVVAALGSAGLIHQADRLRVTMIFGQHLLAAVVEFFFIPLDAFQKTL
jgi:hypothetical protein